MAAAVVNYKKGNELSTPERGKNANKIVLPVNLNPRPRNSQFGTDCRLLGHQLVN